MLYVYQILILNLQAYVRMNRLQILKEIWGTLELPWLEKSY